MASRVLVVIPWQHADDRARGLGFVLDFYETCFPQFTVRIGLGSDDPFSRGRAVNRVVAKALEPFDVLVFNDADTLVTPSMLTQAVGLAEQAPGQVKAYTSYSRLGRDATLGLREFADVHDAAGDAIVWSMPVGHAHGAMVMRRECFEEIGGYDPRFQGWGYEDLAFDEIVQALYGPCRRVAGDLKHLWHEPHPTAAEGDPFHEANMKLHDRYARACGDAEALLAIRREAPWLDEL